MRKFLIGLALLAPAPLAAQTTVQQNGSPSVCGSVCGAANGTLLISGVGQVQGVNAVNGATAGYAVLYDAATIPADGALTPALIRWCIPIAVNTGVSTPFQAPIQFYYGLTFFVSSTSCTTKAAVSYGFVNVQVR